MRVGPGAIADGLLMLMLATGLSFVVLAPAVAGPVAELEGPGTATNNTIGTAQAIPAADFTLPPPPTVFNPPGFPTATVTGLLGSPDALSPDVDFFSFDGSGRVYFDIDNDPFTFDTMLSLFNSAGTLIGFGDDSCPADPGSTTVTDLCPDSFLGVFTLPAPGLYFIAVTQFDNEPTALNSAASFRDLTRPDGVVDPPGRNVEVIGAPLGLSTFALSGEQPVDALGYTLHISLEGRTAAVPAPATLVLLGAALVGLAWRARPRP